MHQSTGAMVMDGFPEARPAGAAGAANTGYVRPMVCQALEDGAVAAAPWGPRKARPSANDAHRQAARAARAPMVLRGGG